MNVEAIVFDLDATLVNLGGFVNWKEGQQKVIAAYLECGCNTELVNRCREKGLFDMLNLMWEELCASLPREKAEHIQDQAFCALDHCESQGVDMCHLMPGMYGALEWLRQRNVKMAIATSNSTAVVEQILIRQGLRNYFAVVVGRTPRLRMKPHPDQVITCFKMLGTDPRRGVVVGDSPRDVKAAKAAGAYSIAVPASFTRRKTLEEAGVDKIIESLKELPDLIASLEL